MKRPCKCLTFNVFFSFYRAYLYFMKVTETNNKTKFSPMKTEIKKESVKVLTAKQLQNMTAAQKKQYFAKLIKQFRSE